MKFFIKKSSIHDKAENYFGLGSYVNPVTWVRALAGKLIGNKTGVLVLPAQKLSEDNTYLNDTFVIEHNFKDNVASNSEISLNFHEVENFDGAILETMELSHKIQLDKPINEQNFVIFSVGNDMCMQDLYKDLYTECQKLELNIVSFNFRNVIRSSGKVNSQLDLIYDVIAQVERLLNAGVDPKNITLVGHSLGAAIVTLASFLYYKKGTPIKVFNGRSFSSFSALKYHQLDQRKLEQDLTGLQLYFSNFELNVAPYFAEIPEEYKEYIVIKQNKKKDKSDASFQVPDGVIPHPASLHVALKADRKKEKRSQEYTPERALHLQNRKVISTNRIFGFGHNDPLSALKCRDGKETADEFCRHFIRK